MFLPTKAFTLIELLVVISIITILSGAMLPSFVGFIKNQNVKQAREQIKSDLRTIQTNALSNAIPIGQTPVSRIYWGVIFRSDQSDYTYFATPTVIGSPSVASCSAISSSGKFTLPSNVVSAGDYCIVFDSANGSKTGSSFVAIKDSVGTIFECIKINDTGLITTGTWNTGSLTCN